MGFWDPFNRESSKMRVFCSEKLWNCLQSEVPHRQLLGRERDEDVES